MPSLTVKVPVLLEVEIEWGTSRTGASPSVTFLYDFELFDFVAVRQKVLVPRPALRKAIEESPEVADAITSYEQPEADFGSPSSKDPAP